MHLLWLRRRRVWTGSSDIRGRPALRRRLLGQRSLLFANEAFTERRTSQNAALRAVDEKGRSCESFARRVIEWTGKRSICEERSRLLHGRNERNETSRMTERIQADYQADESVPMHFTKRRGTSYAAETALSRQQTDGTMADSSATCYPCATGS